MLAMHAHDGDKCFAAALVMISIRDLADEKGSEAGASGGLRKRGNIIFGSTGHHAGTAAGAAVYVDHHPIARAHAFLLEGDSRNPDSW